MPPKNNSGFTLLETLFYIAILSFFLASLLGITYQSLDSSQQISNKITLQQEANFILRKIDWALTGARNVSATAQDIQMARDTSPTQVYFRYDSINKTIQMSTDNLNYFDLNSVNTKVTSTAFSLTTSGSAQYANITVALDGQNFSLKKYIR